MLIFVLLKRVSAFCTYQVLEICKLSSCTNSCKILIFYWSFDIWMSESSATPIQRKGIIGYTDGIGGICSSHKFAIVEYNGFNQIQNAAHELAHRFNWNLSF